MSVQPTTFNDFSGGMVTDRAPHLLSPGEVIDAQDVLLGVPGVLRKRGNFHNVGAADRNTDTVFSDPVICAGVHSYHSDSHGIFVVTSSGTQSHLLWWVPGYNWCEVFDYGYPATEGDVAAGFTPPPRKDEDADDRNARFSATIVSTDAFTVAAKVSRTAFSGSPNANQFRVHKTMTVNGSENDYYFEFTVILAAADTGLGTSPETRVPAILDGDNPCPYVETVNRYSFLAGDPGNPQKYRWSHAENCHRWTGGTDADWEHIPTTDNGDIKALSTVAGMLCLVKSDGIFLLRVLGKPPSATNDQTNWDQDQVTNVGTLDGRSVARWRDEIVFASHHGVYRFDGSSVPTDLTEGKINGYYRQVISGWGASDRAVGSVVGDFYLLSIHNNGAWSTLCCYLPTGAWCRFSNLKLVGACRSVGDRAVYGFLDSGRAVNLTLMFTDPDGFDVEGDGPYFDVALPRVATVDSTRMKTFKQVDIDYESQSFDGATLDVSVIHGVQPLPPTDHTVLVGQLPPQGFATSVQPQTCYFTAHDRALGVRIRETRNGQIIRMALYSVSLYWRASRSGKVNA